VVVVEETHSKSERETEDNSTLPDKKSAVVTKAATRDTEEREPQSDDSSTDVEDTETSKPSVVHAGDGDRADSMLL